MQAEQLQFEGFHLNITNQMVVNLRRFKILRGEYIKHLQGYRGWSDANRIQLEQAALRIAETLDSQILWTDI